MTDDPDTKTTDPAEARKRRKAIITSQRDEGDNDADAETDSSEPKKRKADDAPHHNKGKKKTQVRYDPSIPMNKDQLAAWRREARRVRNRESAAASRQRIRSRINELEDELDDWKDKYEKAMEQLQSLEQSKQSESV